MARINRLTKGSTPTLLEADKGNELIDAINVLNNMQIGYGDQFRVDVGNLGVNITIPQPPQAQNKNTPQANVGNDFKVGIDYANYQDTEINFLTGDGDKYQSIPVFDSPTDIGIKSLKLNGFWGGNDVTAKSMYHGTLIRENGIGGKGKGDLFIDSVVVNGFGAGDLTLKSTNDSVDIDDTGLTSGIYNKGKAWATGFIDFRALRVNGYGGDVNVTLKSKTERVCITESGGGDNATIDFDALALNGITCANCQLKSSDPELLKVQTQGETITLVPKEVVLTSGTPEWLSVNKTGKNSYSISFLPPPATTIEGCNGSVQVYKTKG